MGRNLFMVRVELDNGIDGRRISSALIAMMPEYYQLAYGVQMPDEPVCICWVNLPGGAELLGRAV